MRISSRDRISTDATSRRVRAAKSKSSTSVRLELAELLVLISPNQRDRGFEQRLDKIKYKVLVHRFPINNNVHVLMLHITE